MINRRRYGWAKLKEYCEILYGKMFNLSIKWAVYRNCVEPQILCGSEAWLLRKKHDKNFAKNRQIHDERSEWNITQDIKKIRN